MKMHTLVMFCAASALACACPAAEIDPNSPKGALKSFYEAMESGDDAAIRPMFQTANDAEKDLADAYAAMLNGAKALGEAAKNKFAATGDSLSKGLPARDQI